MTGALAAAAFHAGRLAYLADDTDVGDETHKAGPIAVVVIILLCVACFFLFRSMSKHLRTARENVEAQVEAEQAQATVGAPAETRATEADGPATPGAEASPRPAATPKSRSHTTDE